MMKPTAGRLLATAGCAVKARICCMVRLIPPFEDEDAAGRADRGARSVEAVSSLISYTGMFMMSR